MEVGRQDKPVWQLRIEKCQMLLFVVLAFSFHSAIGRARLDSIPRRILSVPPMSSTPEQLNSGRDSWYIIHFTQKPDVRLLGSHGITLTPRSYISPTRYCLYLSSSQARFLVETKLAKVGEVRDKLIEQEIPFHKASFLHVETSSTFTPTGLDGHFKRRSPTHYTVISKDIETIAKKLATLPEVLFVWPRRRPQLHNRVASGFSQLNTRTLNSDLAFDRYLQNQSITGQGVVVTVWDSYLDTNSTFFYDASHPIENATIVAEHRKVVYNFWHAESEVEHGEHGTHTSGTIGGNATCWNCSAAQYNGVAPNVKLAFRGWPIEDAEFDAFATELVEIMNSVNSTITSNSWGASATDISLISSVDQAAFDNLKKLFVFSAGNDGDLGHMTVGSPGEAKNVLTVGALNQLQVENVLQLRRYILAPVFWREISAWATLLSGTPSVVFPYDEDGQPYVALRNEMNFTLNLANYIVYVTSQAELATLMAKPEAVRPFAVITNTSFEENSTTFPVLVLDPLPNEFWDFVYVHYNQSQGISVYREYREPRQTSADLAFFSSLGPALSGIIKPEIVAPGAGIVSARSAPKGVPNHDLNPLDRQIMGGTSMSCPNVAGSAALVTEYLHRFHNVNASSSLVKAVIIGSADLPYREDSEPNVEYGFGVLNLGGHLPGERGSFNVLVADEVDIADKTHLKATIDVTDANTELRVTISFTDAVTFFDGYVPLFGELALMFESPSGQLFRGTQHPSDGEDYFSAHQRVIIHSGQVEIGLWTIHVIALLVPEVLDSVNFSAVVRGSLRTPELAFEQT
jgi:subtilisin family serine protease